MTITSAICNSFKQEILVEVHNFTNGTDNFKIALYSSNSATLSKSTTAYTAPADATADPTNTYEVTTTSSGYSAGGNTLTSQAVANQNNVATVDFADTSWSSATFTAAFGVIYNNTQSDKLVVVLDFGGSKSASNGTFTISFPDPTSGSPAGSDAIISLTS